MHICGDQFSTLNFWHALAWAISVDSCIIQEDVAPVLQVLNVLTPFCLDESGLCLWRTWAKSIVPCLAQPLKAKQGRASDSYSTSRNDKLHVAVRSNCRVGVSWHNLNSSPM